MLLAASTTDILLELSNPGRWMIYCRIAEHHDAGMKMVMNVGRRSALACEAGPPPVQRVAPRVIPRYHYGMKTAISLPDELFASADSLAKRMNVSRSELYATAVAEYVAKHRSADVTAKLNAVYADLPSGVDHALRRAQARSVAEEW